MTSETIQILISMVCYMLVVVGIGLFFAKRAKQSSDNYFLGGRSLGPWVAAMSAEASDMSGWLLMGLPGVAYWCGLADAAWTAIGLAVGTYVNWLIIAKRLRNYSVAAGNSITLPEFFSNRFNEKKKVLLSISAIFILIFFTVYASSCFVTCGKLFSTLFDTDYHTMMILGAAFVVFYTFIGGFLAESASDFMQAIVMIFALVVVLVVGVVNAGGIGQVIENAKSIDGYFMLTGIASPEVDANGVQISGLFGEAQPYGFLSIISTLAWGLGYFGMPQVLLRFMAIRKADELKRSRRIATVWVVISLFVAVMIGIIGRSVYPTHEGLNTSSGAENVFITLSQNLLPPLLAGIVMAGILAATISSSDSYLLIAASAFAKNIYGGLAKKDASDKQVMVTSRIVLLIIAIIGVVIAWDENSVIFTLVSFAWAGFGATFGPVMIMSLFWKRINQKGAVAGMITGGVMVFVWKLLLNPIGGVFAIYELLPAFILSLIAIVVVSLLTKKPDEEITKTFEKVKAMSKGNFIEQN
ncbi:MAG: sodium/proline symporter PutP [Clostridiales bacterium]|nr:sodium/proline symporter PutP [Clostridiales bacterium]